MRWFLLSGCLLASAVAFAAPEYWVAVGSYREATNADRFVEQSGDMLGTRPSVRSVITDTGIYYRVSVGPFSDRPTAELALEEARSAGISGAWLYEEVSDALPLMPESSLSGLSEPLPVEPASPPAPENRRSTPRSPPTVVPEGYDLHRLHRTQ